MNQELTLLLGAALSIGFIHTLLGPDHYIPFVAMSKAGSWSRKRLIAVVTLCGVGHVMGSIVIGILGVTLGWAIGDMESFEGIRGIWAAWALIGFGLAYMAWGIRKGIKNKTHTHLHYGTDGSPVVHGHHHGGEHSHASTPDTPRSKLTPWTLFIVFILGPCEPLIPLLIIPAAEHSWWGVVLVAGVFGIVTISTMLAVALVLDYGVSLLPIGRLERWSHALAGFALFVSGVAVQWLGL